MVGTPVAPAPAAPPAPAPTPAVAKEHVGYRCTKRNYVGPAATAKACYNLVKSAG